MASPIAMPIPSAPSNVGIGFSRKKISVRARAAPAFSLACPHASPAISETRALPSRNFSSPTSAEALSGMSSPNSSPPGLIITKGVRISRTVCAGFETAKIDLSRETLNAKGRSHLMDRDRQKKEEEYWRQHHSAQPYATKDYIVEHYAP